jgi:hypothetical protein
MQQAAIRRSVSWPLLISGMTVAIALASTIWLWAHYGPVVFFEAIRVGFVVCFG